mgnify:CR=1 FL=1
MARAKKEAALTPEERLQAALVPDWEWPYKLPENWCWVKASGVARIYTGNSISEKIKADKYAGQQEGLLFIATKDIGFDNAINYETDIRIPDYPNFKIAPANTALLCIEGGSAGRKVGFVNREVCFGNKLCAFAAEKVNSKFIYYILQSQYFIQQFNNRKHGLIGGVSVNDLAEIGFPLSPLAEQQRIVDRIESLFAKLDEAREKAQAVVDSFETHKAAILHKAFTGELTAKWREEHGVGMESWKTRELAECFEIVSGIQKTPARSPKDNPVPYLTVANVYRGRIDLSDIRYFEVTSKEIEKLKLQDKDILIVEGNGSGNEIGRCAIWHNELPLCIHQNHIIRMRRKIADILPEYALHYLNSEAGKSIMRERSKTTAGLFNLSAGKIKTIPLPMASLDEQSEIVHLIDSLLEKEQWAKEAAEIVLDQIDLMKKSILARAFRGELGTNDPSEESAVELLRQVIEQEDGDVIRPKAKAKRIAIPAEIKPLLSGANEEAIVKLLLKAAPQSVSTQTVMSISKKKFELMDALRNLEKKQIVSKSDSGEYSLVR